MNSNLIIHSPHPLNSTKFVNHLLQYNKYNTQCKYKYYKEYNTYFIPFTCNYVNHYNLVIMGRFINPIWNVLERTVVTRGAKFEYVYLANLYYKIEYKPVKLSNYRMYGKPITNNILASQVSLRPNSLLLFPVSCKIAEPLIEQALL